MTRSNTLRKFSKILRQPWAWTVIFLLLACTLSGKTFAWDETAYNDGKTLGAEMDAKLGSSEAVKERISNPMTSEDTSMRTMNDQKTFGSQISAPSSKAFLEILIQPSGTGDITSLSLRQDTNFDGTPDYGYSVSSPVSGICSNGFISANPGTWNQKRFYTW